MKMALKIALLILACFVVLAGYYLFRYLVNPARLLNFRAWMRDPAAHTDWAISANTTCGDAPFQIPTDGFIGFLWGDSFRPGHRHQGIDIFGGQPPGEVPIYAACDGYLTRLPDWKSTVIIRIPNDPLSPGRQIWAYYTHMADEEGSSFVSEDFPLGTYEVFVKAGTLLGYQGNYSGTPDNPTGVHLHFSLVLDDGSGKFLNELEIKNTLDPSPYFNLPLNAKLNKDQIPTCDDSG